MHTIHKDYFPSFYFAFSHRVILLTRFCRLLNTVAILARRGRGDVPQVPQWHDASDDDDDDDDDGGDDDAVDSVCDQPVFRQSRSRSLSRLPTALS